MKDELIIKLDKGKIDAIIKKGKDAFVNAGVKKELFVDKKIQPIKVT